MYCSICNPSLNLGDKYWYCPDVICFSCHDKNRPKEVNKKTNPEAELIKLEIRKLVEEMKTTENKEPIKLKLKELNLKLK